MPHWRWVMLVEATVAEERTEVLVRRQRPLKLGAPFEFFPLSPVVRGRAQFLDSSRLESRN